ncbi:MAG TPA: zinc-ribbon domain containing protein [Dehalococcoidia bacterium]|nr:zinc-ribbon domain containing protein [Dehalococcoidia bacterium]
MGDKTLTCRDCGASFLFTESEQQFYSSKGFTNEPSRCPDCRASRKASGGGGYSGGGGGGYSSGPREMHTATCASCGNEAKVPFVPRGDRPVYCSDCFSQQRSSSTRY